MKAEKVIVVVGRSPTYKKVRCRDFLPGLVSNQSPDKSRTASLINITHRDTGVAILNYVPVGALSDVKTRLQKENWSLSLGEIFHSNNHREAVEGTIEYMANQDSSKKQEKRIADDLEGRVQPASGSRWGYKRDVTTPEFFIEAKTSDASSVSIVEKDLRFLKQQAYQQGKIPVYIVELRGESVAVLPKEEVYPQYIETTTLVGVRGTKSFPINAKMLTLVETEVAEVSVLSGRYLIMNYTRFLEIAKGET